MPFGETKVYFDGSHYIAIPHTANPARKRPKPPEEVITVIDKQDESSEPVKATGPSNACDSDGITADGEVKDKDINAPQTANKPLKTERKLTRKELFDELYKKHIQLKKKERKEKILTEMRPFFETEEQARNYVNTGFERKERNLISRRVRMVRKANLAKFNYFCTFTYDDKKHTEESFRKGLQTCFRNLCNRKGWKYMGVWERSPEKQRLHFHGLFAIPENAMTGGFITVKDYSTTGNKMQKSVQSIYFNERFGRNDFKELDPRLLGESIKYLLKYIEKTGEKIVYSKGLYQYFISDIMDADIACRIGQEDKKLLLFDNFRCWDEGVFMGRVSDETIAKMRKSN